MVLIIILILSSFSGNNLSVKFVFLMKIVVYMILVVSFYSEIFSVSSNPELILLGLYFNSFYTIYYSSTKNNGTEDTEEQINDPEDPTGPTELSTNPTSETDRDSLPSYEESFNYPTVSNIVLDT